MKKKISTRIMAAFLAVMMTLSMMPINNVLAAGSPVIDPTQKGKVTIIKALNGDQSTVIPDVEFSYLKIADIVQVEHPAGTVAVMYMMDNTDSLTTALKTKLSLTPDYTDGTKEYYYANTIQAKLPVASADFITFVKGNGATAMTKTDSDGKTTASNLELGLYLFVESDYPAEITEPCNPFLISLPSNVTAVNNGTGGDIDYDNESNTTEWLYDVTAVPKNEKKDIGIDKTIIVDKNDVDDPTDDDTSRGEDYQIGDTITYQIKAGVPGSIANIEKYYIADALSSGLTFTDSSVKVWGIKSDGTKVLLTAGTEYTVKTADADMVVVTLQSGGPEKSDFVIDFTTTAMGDYETVYVEYEAVLNKDAVIGATGGNPNDVNLVFSESTSTNSDTKEVTPTKPRPTVYTYKAAITKTGEGTDVMDGVKFELRDISGNKINVSEVASGTSGDYYLDSAGTSEIVVTGGVVNIKGLESGQYQLVEIETKSGYVLLKEPIYINIAAKFASEAYVSDANGSFFLIETGKKYYNASGQEIVLDGLSVGDYVEMNGAVYTDDAQQSPVDKYEHKADKNTVIGITSNYTVTDGVISFTVQNKKGFDLPSTGGMGTYIFTIGGLVVMAAAVVLLMKRKKKVN